MTPYRERREKGYYHPEGLPPESTHSHHLSGLQTATKPPAPQAPDASGKSNVKIKKGS